MHTSLNTAGSNNYFRPVGTVFLQTNEEKISPRSSFKVAFSIRPVFPSMMHRAQQGIHLSGMAVLTPTVTAHISVLTPAASALASPAPLHRASTPCKASFFSAGQHPILPKVMGKNWLVWEIRLSQDRNGWTRGWRICTLWRWWKERVFVVLTPEEGKAPQGHLSTPMHWDGQREQVRKKINPKSFYSSVEIFFNLPVVVFSRNLWRYWRTLRCNDVVFQQHPVLSPLHTGKPGHFSVPLWTENFLPFLCLALNNSFKCSWHEQSSALVQDSPLSAHSHDTT